MVRVGFGTAYLAVHACTSVVGDDEGEGLVEPSVLSTMTMEGIF